MDMLIAGRITTYLPPICPLVQIRENNVELPSYT